MRFINKLIAGSVFLSLSLPTLATQNAYPYMGITAGFGIAKIGKSSIENYGETLDPREYRSTSNNTITPLFGVNSGYEFNLSQNFIAALGLGLYQSLNHEAKGEIWSYVTAANPSTPIYTHIFDYKYKVKSTTLMLEGQLIRKFNNQLSSFVAIGAGPSWNDAQSYQEKRVIPEIQPTSNLLDRKTLAFAYQVAIGLAYSLTDKDRFSISYRFADLGCAKFDNNADPSLYVDNSYMFNIGHIKTHALLFNYTFLFN